MTPTLFAVLAYVALQLGLGFWVSRRIATEEDFLVAGRRLGYPLVTLSLFATWFGAETCVGAAGAVYESGIAGSIADPFGYSCCLLFLGLALAAPLWRRKLTTLGDLFRQRYSPGVERLSVLLIAPTSVMWAAAQIRAFGQVLSASSELAVTVSIAIAAAVVIVYTMSGGLLADAITDLIQGAALILGLVILAVATAAAAGGFDVALARIDASKLAFADPSRSFWETAELWAVPICGSVIAQELAARVLAARSARVAQRSALVAAALYLGIGLLPLFVGLTGAHMVPALEHPEQILPRMAQVHLSPVLYVLFAGALVSAILSTVDSALLSAASLVSHNLVVPMWPGLSEAGKVRVARICVVVFGLCAWVLATYADGVYHLVEQASAFGSSGVFICVFAALYTRWGGAASAWAALSIGAGVWMWGAFVTDSPVAFVVSLGAALGAYVGGGLAAAGYRRLRARA